MKKLVVLFVLILSVCAYGRDWYVSADNHNLTDTTTGTTNIGSDSVNIVVAFQNAGYGDTIYINQGYYRYGDDYTTTGYSWLTLNDSNIVVIGVGSVMLDGVNSKRILFADYCEDITIKNIKFYRGYSHYDSSGYIHGASIRAWYGSNFLVENCVFERNNSYAGGASPYNYGGVLFLPNSKIKKSGFYDNYLGAAAANIYNYGGVIAGNGSEIINCLFIRNGMARYIVTSQGIVIGGSMKSVINNIFYKNYGYLQGGGDYPLNIVSIGSATILKNNLFYGNYNYAGSEVNIGYGDNPHFEDPEFIDENLFPYLQDTSPILNAGYPYDGIYQNIGSYSKGQCYGKADTYAWQDWTDEFGDTISDGLSSYFYIDNYDSSLRLSNQYDTGIAVSPIYYIGEYPRYISVDLEVDEARELPVGQKQCIDFDDTTQEREIQYRTSDTLSGITSASWQVGYGNRDINITQKYVQVRLRFSKLVEY